MDPGRLARARHRTAPLAIDSVQPRRAGRDGTVLLRQPQRREVFLGRPSLCSVSKVAEHWGVVQPLPLGQRRASRLRWIRPRTPRRSRLGLSQLPGLVTVIVPARDHIRVAAIAINGEMITLNEDWCVYQCD